MKPIYEYNVVKPAKLLEFLYEQNKEQSKKTIKSYLIHGEVYVDHKPTTQYDYPLVEGQKVQIQSVKSYYRVQDRRLEIIFEDDYLIAVSKPCGLLSVSTDDENNETMYRLVSDYVKQENKNNKIFVVHRIDKDTSGVLLFAKNELVKNKLQDNWDTTVEKRGYIAIVEGKLKDDEGTITSYLQEFDNGMVYSTKNPDEGKLAITHYKKIRENNDYTWLDISLETGRKNQIRVQMHDLGTPVIGDKKYGSKKNPYKRLGLHAYTLVLMHPITNKKLQLKAKVPAKFNVKKI